MERWIWVAVVAAACGGGSGNAMPDAPSTKCRDMGGSACFQLPTAPLSDHDGNPSVLGCGITPTPAPADVMLSGKTLAYGTGTAIGGATANVYTSVDFATPVSTLTSAGDGTYSVTLPAGTPDMLFGAFRAQGYLDLYTHQVRTDLSQAVITNYNLRYLTSDNIESASLLVKELWDPTVAVIAGVVYDCNRNVIQHAEVVLSTTQGMRSFVPHATLYYSAAGVVPLAVYPEDRSDTNDNGAFVVYRVPGSGPLYVQAWGFKDAAAQAQGEAGLTLVAEAPVHTAVNSVSQLLLWAK